MLMDVFTNIVLAHGAKGELDIALAKCDVQLEKVGDSKAHRAIINNLKGGIYLAQKKVDKAETAFSEAIEEHPDFMPPYYSLARIYLSGQETQKAIDQYKTILEKNPKQAGPNMLLGTIYDMQKRFDLSEKHYRAALEADPKFAPAANNLAYLLADNEDKLDEALKYARIAKEKMPGEPSVMDTLGWIYYKKGLYDSAIQEFSDSLEKLPENATVQYHMGAALFKIGQKVSARTHLEKALALDANFDGADEARRMLSEI
jgi:tetratricopeptide (TPR) repeat protein